MTLKAFCRFSLVLALAVVVFAGPLTRAADEPKGLAITDLKRDKPVDFESEILPVFKSNCLACHNAATAEGELVLETPQTILAGGESGAVVKPGDAMTSLLLRAAAHIEKPYMPPSKNKVGAKELTADQLGLLKLWIAQGAKGEVKAGRGPVNWQPLPPGLNAIYSIAVSPDGQYLAVGRANQIFIYHLPTKQLVTRLTDPDLLKQNPQFKAGTAHLDFVQSLRFSPDGMYLASGGYRVVKLWKRPDAPTRFELANAAAQQVMATDVSLDGKWIATAGNDGVVHLFNGENGQPARELKGHAGAVSSVKFSSDSTRLLTGGDDKTLRVWNVADGALITTIGAPAEVKTVAWAMKDALLVSAGGDNNIRVWKAPAADAVKQLAGVPAQITAMDVRRDRAQIAFGSADGKVVIIDASNGQAVRTIDAHQGAVAAVAFRYDNSQLITAGADKTARVWNAGDGNKVFDLVAALNVVAEEAKKQAEANKDNADLAKAAEEAANIAKSIDAPIAAASLAPAGNQLAVSWGGNKHAIFSIEGDKSKRVTLVNGIDQPISRLVYSNDAGMVFAVVNDGTLRGVGTNDGNTRFNANHGSPIHDVAYSADGRYLATAGENKEVKLWNAANGSPAAKPQYAGFDAPVKSVALSHDGKRLIAGAANNVTRLYDTDSGDLIEASFIHAGSVDQLAFLGQQSESILSASADKTVRQWQSSLQRVLAGHSQPVTSLDTVRATDNQFVSGSADGTMRWWNAENGQQVRSYNHGAAITSVAVRPDGQFVASAGANNVAKLFKADNGQQIKELKGDPEAYASAAKLDMHLAFVKNEVNYYKKEAEEADKRKKAEDEALKKAQDAVTAATKTLEEKDKAFNEQKGKWEAANKALADGETAVKTGEETKKTAEAAKTAADENAKKLAEAQTAAQNDVNGKQNTVNQVTTKHQQAKAALDKATAEAKQAADKAAAAKTAFDTAKADADAKAKAAADAKKAADDKKDDANLAKAAEDAKKVADEAGKKATDAQTALTDAQKKQTDADAETKKATDAFAAVEKEKTDAEAELKKSQDAFAVAKKASDDAQAKATDANNKLNEANKALADATNNKNKAQTEVNNLKAPFEKAQNEFTSAQTGKTSAENAVKTSMAAQKKADESVAETKADFAKSEETVKKVEATTADAKKAAGETDKPVKAVAFSADNKSLATAGDDGAVYLWSADTGDFAGALRGKAGPLVTLASLPDGAIVAAGAANKATVFDPNAGWTLARKIGNGAPDSPLEDRVIALAFHPDGHVLATGGGVPSRSGELKLWNVDNGSLIYTVKDAHSDTLFSIDFTRDGKRLATSAADKFVKTWDVSDLANVKFIRSFEGHTHHVLGVSWAYNGRELVSSGADQAIKIWNFVTGEQIKTVTGFNKEVTSVNFIGTSDDFFSAAGDAQVRRIKDNGGNVRSYGGASDFVNAADVTPDGVLGVAGGQDAIARVWDLNNGQMIASFEPPKEEAKPETK